MADGLKADEAEPEQRTLARRPLLSRDMTRKAAATCGAVLGFVLLYEVTMLDQSRPAISSSAALSGHVADLTTKVNDVAGRAEVLRLEFQQLRNNLAAGGPQGAAGAEVKASLDSLATKVSGLENALTTDAQKALSLPLLQRDLESFKAQELRA
jgi:hypothetical protein